MSRDARSPRRFARQDGFSLVEVLLAALITAGGLVGTFSLIDGAQGATTTSQARDGAIALHREVVEAARGVPYERLTPSSVVREVQQRPGLSDGRVDDSGWTVRRRGITYAITLGVCAVDDPRDGVGAHEPGLFCAASEPATPQQCAQVLGVAGVLSNAVGTLGANVSLGDCGLDVNLDGTIDGLADLTGTVCVGTCGGGAADAAPADYKRVVALVRWTTGSGNRWLLQSTTVANPGTAGAPAVSGLTQPSSAITNGTSMAFSAQTSMDAAALGWSVDGTPAGNATGSAKAWSFTWSLGAVSVGTAPGPGEVLDGTYVIGAKAFDAQGQSGATRSSTVEVNRRAPYPVARFEAGRNGTAVDFEWSPAKERDVVGYRVYVQPALGSPSVVCSTEGATSCRETGAPAGARTYYAVALDRAPGGAVREGIASTPTVVTLAGTTPGTPQGLQAAAVSGGTKLTWTAPVTGAAAVDHYVIYRDGQTFADRYDRTGTGAELEYLDTQPNGQQHTYRVTAVGTELSESAPTAAVTK